MLLPFILMIAFFLINLLIAFIVYQDAKKMTDSPVLWFFIVLLLPLFIGLIIYFVFRSEFEQAKQACPSCQHTIEKSYVYCPNCHTSLKKTCNHCHALVEESFKVCPYCGDHLLHSCRHCGEAIDVNYIICPACGTKQEE